METNPISDLIVNILGAVIGGAILSTVAYVIYRYIQSRPKVRRITKSTDKDLDATLDLYETVIDEDTRITTEELVSWIEEDRKARRDPNNTIFHYLMTCKSHGQVIGFAKFIFCQKSQFLFVAYFGINKNNPTGRREASAAIIRRISRMLVYDPHLKLCKGIVAECLKPQNTREPQEQSHRRARIRLFQETAKRMNMPLFVLDLDYIQPVMPTGAFEQAGEEPLALIYIPVRDNWTQFLTSSHTMKKSDALQIIRFVYFRIYGPTYRHNNAENTKYNRYLIKMMRTYERQLPKTIKLLV